MFRINVFQRVLQGLVFYSKFFLDIENVVDASKQLDILTLAISINLERPLRQSGSNVQYFGCGHVRHGRSLLSKHCVRAKVILHYVSTENNTAFVFLELLFQIRISWDDMSPETWQSEPSFLLCVPARQPLLFHFTLHSRPAGKFFDWCRSLSSAALASGIFIAWGIRLGFVRKIAMSQRIIPSVSNVVFMTPLNRLLGHGIFVIHELRFDAHD